MEKAGSNARKPQLGITVSDQLVEALEDVVAKTGLTRSHIAREALWDKIAEIHKTHAAYVSHVPAAEEAAVEKVG